MQPRDRAARSSSRGLTVCQRLAVGEDQVGAVERAERPSVWPRSSRWRPRRGAASDQRLEGAPGRVRWMAPRNSGVSSWSTSIARPASQAVPGCSSCSRR